MAKKRGAAAAPAESARLNPAALPIDQLATLLSRAGGQPITGPQIRSDIDAGAPSNADGTLHLVHYTAWLAAQAD